MKNFAVSVLVVAAYFLLGLGVGWVIDTAAAQLLGVEPTSWLVIPGTAILVAYLLFTASTVIKIVPGQEAEVRFRNAFFATVKSGGDLLLPPGFSGITVKTSTSQKTLSTTVIDRNGLEIPVEVTMDYRIHGSRKALTLIDTDKKQTLEGLLQEILEKVCAAFQDYTAKLPIVIFNLKGKTSEVRVEMNRDLLREGLSIEEITKGFRAAKWDKSIFRVAPDPPTIVFYDCIHVLALTVKDVEVPKKIREEMERLLQEFIETAAAGAEMDEILNRMKEQVKEGGNPDLVLGNLYKRLGKVEGGPTVKKLIVDAGEGNNLMAKILAAINTARSE